jgi:two-component system sensor histidine kinase/response regulator
LQGLRILLAEDNEINQQIAVELLEGVGATVQVTGNGRVAVERLTGAPGSFDMVLMDLQMPEMDGYQATAKIRADARFAQLPIIAMTAHATNEERQRCLASGMNDHVSKPIDPAALFETVARYYKPAKGVAPQVAPVVAAAGAAFIAEMPVIDGLDAKDGLARVAGNRKLYLKLLRQFAANEAGSPELIAGQIKAGDFETAERTAHTVKGIAGNLGITDVQATAGGLEKAIREKAGPERIETLRLEFSGILSDLLDRLRPALGAAATTVAASPAIPTDPAQLKEIVVQMLKQLSEFDTAAADSLEAHRGLLGPLFSGEEFAGFEQLVQGYDFAGAEAQLEKIATDKGLK